MQTLNTLIAFFNHPFFILLGGLSATIAILGIIYKIVAWAFGITPVMFRLGLALWGRSIAVIASHERYEDIKASLVDSRIFSQGNIVSVPLNNLEKAKDQTIFLVDWESAGQQIEKIFDARANHQTAVVIYAKPESIPRDQMVIIANRPNTVVVNFRGRLLNDILTSLITTSYDR